jgi:hypothetical protein
MDELMLYVFYEYGEFVTAIVFALAVIGLAGEGGDVIEYKVDRIAADVKDIKAHLTTELTSHDKRIRSLEVQIGGVVIQVKVTWILLMLVISGLVGIAFSVWKGGS